MLKNFNSTIEWVSKNYWIIALIAVRDLLEILATTIDFFKKGGDWSAFQNINWVQTLFNLFITVGTIQMFRLYRQNVKELAQLQRQHQAFFLASALSNLIRIENNVDNRIKFTKEEYRIDTLQESLEKEKIALKNYLLNTAKTLTVEEIEKIVSEYYFYRFK